jgi:hypothetical protein
MIIACATKDKKCFEGEHFDISDYYIIYQLTENKFAYDCIIENVFLMRKNPAMEKTDI